MKIVVQTCIIALALGLCNHARSQYFEKDTIPADMKKHILFADITPAVAFAIQADEFEPVYELGYKHQLKPNKRLRLHAQYKQKEQASDFMPVGVNDSLSLWYYSYNFKREVQLRGGLEWGNYERKVAPFYAVDFIVGYKNERDSRSLFLGEVFENAYQLSEAEADTIVLTLPRYGVITTKDVLGYESRSLLIGVAATFGLRVEMAENWESWIQMSPEIIYNYAYDAKDTETNVSIGTSGNSFVDFRFRLLTFGLAYKF